MITTLLNYNIDFSNKIEFSNGEVINAKLSDDTMDFQEIKLENPILTKSVKFTITDVYSGSKFEDTCIS